MPKTPSAGASSSVGRPALRRNQKCDAARPHCGTCVNGINLLFGPDDGRCRHPTEPQCSYDPVDGLTLAPDTDPVEKIRQLEAQIAQLKNKLHERHGSRSSSPRPGSVGNGSDGGISLPHASLAMMNLISPEAEAQFRGSESGSPELRTISQGSPDPLMDLLFLGWNPDLPDPTTLNHYIDIFFKWDPCGSRVLHRPSFLASMHLPPRDPGFPHSAILHAICTAASRWSPHNIVTLPDGTRRDQFAEFHASKTRHYMDKTMASGEDIFPVLQACILLCWYFYQEGRWVEVWIFAGFLTRVAVPLRLNYPGTFTTHGNNSPGAYLAPPRDFRDLESRRRTWWMTYTSVGGWIHAVDERDLGTELPLRNTDFESEVATVFIRHPPQYTDSFLLLIKAVMLFGRVTDYNVRGNLRAPTAPSKNQNPFFLEGFKELDKLVCTDFLESLPRIFKNNYGVMDGALDTDLYMVHIVPHAATITLHNPYLDFTDPQCASTSRCVNSARSILAAYYMLSGTSLDITRLHPFVVICWYLAAVVQVQLCKYFIEIGDSERESTVWGEINVLRFAMLAYGQCSPIGTRQESLLQGVMREIIRTTAQKQPLEVGVPLYPFSSATLWRKDEASHSHSSPDEGTSSMAPLPMSPPEFDSGAGLSPPATARVPVLGHRRSASAANGGWPMDASMSPREGVHGVY
ncbi:hypothetical protein B0H16DRAFT_1490342 [Mycena metata]|uniref:Xylanolytic transcriptional activator regulatory domain-containing protein n=1 Tax=Mycena metata TaxID=1033252 RepID=A0AAD7P3K2_9AGAR|nr:hypothetical protein B0H16DRAFT_1490342 [Mycena metata]